MFLLPSCFRKCILICRVKPCHIRIVAFFIFTVLKYPGNENYYFFLVC
jgi:hypothetical protein